ncbi:hypothetical protein P4646_11335 [Peribacillus simplex]|uniref:hypothetical protein n=1 Tax=Peribacillus simplex TaxID=1478 RepID=UPI002E217C74|nr:hypothetical protein [Peribacillus simplex]MED4093106.1 hypothetical protein [Peribacillus simplex]
MFINRVTHCRSLPDDYINQMMATDPCRNILLSIKRRMLVYILGFFLIWMPMLAKKTITDAGGH